MSTTSAGEFTIDGRSYPLILPTDMTLGQQLELKRLSDGMTPMGALNAIRELDPNAMRGVLIVSMRSVDPSVKDTAVDDVQTAPLILALSAALKAASDEQDPPTGGGGGEGAAPASS